MADAPADEHASNSIPPILRQRMLNRAATFGEGVQAFHLNASRRRSSVYSDTRNSFRSSSDSLPRQYSTNNETDQLATTQEPSFWHSAPLAFAIVPAFAGLFFQNGGAVVTDILLLAFGSMFLNWCLRSPWEWYHSAQHTIYLDPDEDPHESTILEEDEGIDGLDEDSAETSASHSVQANPEGPTSRLKSTDDTTIHANARKELRTNELTALLACFVGPLLGAYVLHAIRSQLSRPAEGLVSNFNLTIFVMAAELRPVAHIIKMKQARLLHLQRVVRNDANEAFKGEDLQGLSKRIAHIEAQTETGKHSDIEAVKLSTTVRQSLQPQLDALNRAVRRYEKRQVALSMQTEARFQELEGRLKDALSLAAAAARSGQQPSRLSMILSWVLGRIHSIFHWMWIFATSPVRLLVAFLDQLLLWLFGTRRDLLKKKKGTDGRSTGRSSPVFSSKSQAYLKRTDSRI